MAAPSLLPRSRRWRRGTHLQRILGSCHCARLGGLSGWRRQSTAARMSEPEWLGTSYFAPSQPACPALGHLKLDADGLWCCRPTGPLSTGSAAASARSPTARSATASARSPARRSAAASARGYPCSTDFVDCESEESEIPIRICSDIRCVQISLSCYYAKILDKSACKALDDLFTFMKCLKGMVSWRTYIAMTTKVCFFRICCLSLSWYIYFHRGVFPSSKFSKKVQNFGR